MKSAVAYYSRSGRNAALARAVHERLVSRGVPADLVAIEPAHPTSPALGAVKAALGLRTRLKRTYDFSDYEALVLCSPIWAGHMTPVIHEFLMTTGGLPGKRVFNVHSCGGDPGRTREQIAEMLEAQGAHVIGSRYIRSSDQNKPRIFNEFVAMITESIAGAEAAV
jgi:multimeric flavodoxin WrbA